jgi:signal transduction histidine kinase
LIQREEQEKYLKKLQELNATKDKFFSIIAHDIKNPFNTVLGFTELLQLKYDIWDDNKRKKMIDVVSNSAANIYKLLENLLQWSRSQRGIIEFRPENILLLTAIENIFVILSESARQKNIELKYELDNETDTVMADKQMFDTIMRNLISNAIKFTHQGGLIVVRGHLELNKIIISVTDTGIGIAQEDIGKLFRIDANFSSQGTNHETGTGLGLILVNEFVTRHNGTFDVTSEENKGSTFTVSLPAGNVN